MRFTTVLLIVVSVVLLVFVALNWGLFVESGELSFGFVTAELPLGLIMLGLLVLFAAIFGAIVVRLQASALREAHRCSRELEASRQLAEQAEASRFAELRSYLEGELTELAALDADSRAEVLDRIMQAEENLRTVVEESGNSLAASIGEFEDRVTRSKDSGSLRVEDISPE